MEEKTKPKYLIWWIVGGLALAYPLSVGPVRWAFVQGWIRRPGPVYDAIVVFYTPLNWLDHTPEDNFVRWYCDLWAPLP